MYALSDYDRTRILDSFNSQVVTIQALLARLVCHFRLKLTELAPNVSHSEAVIFLVNYAIKQRTIRILFELIRRAPKSGLVRDGFQVICAPDPDQFPLRTVTWPEVEREANRGSMVMHKMFPIELPQTLFPLSAWDLCMTAYEITFLLFELNSQVDLKRYRPWVLTYDKDAVRIDPMPNQSIGGVMMFQFFSGARK